MTAYPFKAGPVRILRDNSLRARARRVWRRVTWWRWGRFVVVAIDVDRGVITTAPMQWSWRRWRWERVS